MRRTMLYLPGNNPNMLVRGHLFGSDGIVMDMEDAVALSEKDAARVMISKFLRRGDFGSVEVTVRINGADTEFWKKDLEAVVPCKRLDGIRLPKADSPQVIKDVDEELSRLEDKYGIAQGHIKLFCILETAYGIWHAYDVATASRRVTAILPGGEDLVADLKTSRTPEGTELEWSRRMIVIAARAAGVDAIDLMFPRVTDDEGLRRDAQFSKDLGFDGKSVIHPNQIPVIHEIFTPSEKEIEKAQRIIAAAEDARARGLGTVSVDGRMVDVPVVKRARYILVKAGLEKEDE
ncbi:MULTISPECIES: HpcH/HpaI aldolase/citrate lyase family protein [unclassified Pyramidobacter]|uniref:HpcH/HpaI aldolase/citrate lyase family protein n=2 Tax=Pyramidobacter TaxID=638847 RepID=UPI000EA1829F|nr:MULTISPECIES: aldolase/citrate lyase family protein [unclassified Pyramidobacter]MDY3212329.1 aldolase/citrate lyase family protein [Pyramidobacter sp.]RKJ76134.1 CoA ester lyase [Pyramidobacter sp. CG50-2]